MRGETPSTLRACVVGVFADCVNDSVWLLSTPPANEHYNTAAGSLLRWRGAPKTYCSPSTRRPTRETKAGLSHRFYRVQQGTNISSTTQTQFGVAIPVHGSTVCTLNGALFVFISRVPCRSLRSMLLIFCVHAHRRSFPLPERTVFLPSFDIAPGSSRVNDRFAYGSVNTMRVSFRGFDIIERLHFCGSHDQVRSPRTATSPS